ncbi:MAG: N-acetylmuramidase [Firmicutes bacterium]|nr:N-acetylmuramidase [Bacillota bacterium]
MTTFLFDLAFKTVIKHEGGYVNDPKDLGGETKYGISKRSYPNVDIKNLTLDQAKEIYYRDFWVKGKCDKINNEKVAIKLFDFGVNMGTQQASRLIQRALRSVGMAVVEDGIIGTATLSAVNNVNSMELLAALKSEAAGFYRGLVIANATQQKFLNGWLNRAYS